MKSLPLIFLLFLTISISGYSQGKKSIQKLKSRKKHYHQITNRVWVWVKTKDTHRTFLKPPLQEGRVNIQSAQPLVNPKSARHSAARSGPTKLNIDISLYYQVRFDSQFRLKIILMNSTPRIFRNHWPAYRSKAMYIRMTAKGSQYYLTLIKAFEAWSITKGDESLWLEWLTLVEI